VNVGVLAWAQRASVTSEEAREQMQDVNEDTDWNVEQMLDTVVLERPSGEEWSLPSTMGRHFRFTASEERIRERCEKLRDAGLLAPISRGASVYELATLGRLYLAGELDAESLPRRRTVG
jgi:hypothetical protein